MTALASVMTTLGLMVVLLSAGPAAAVPVSDTLEVSETLGVVVIHGAAGCSSGWVLVAGMCQAEDAEPVAANPALVAEVAPPAAVVFAETETTPVNLVAPASEPLTHTPEPATLLLLGTGLTLVAHAVRRRATSG